MLIWSSVVLYLSFSGDNMETETLKIYDKSFPPQNQ